MDVASADPGEAWKAYRPVKSALAAGSPGDVDAAARALVEAERPVIYAGQGDIRTYAFRVANMGTLTPLDMKRVVDAFAASLEELGIAPAPRR